jgi:predicted nucleic acid-binding protein
VSAFVDPNILIRHLAGDPPARVAELVRAILAFPAVVVVDAAMLLRALEPA